MGTGWSPHHDAVVDEALAVAGGLEVRVLLGAGDPDVPHAPPGLVELQVNRVHARVVRGHGVAHVHRDVVLLETGTRTHTRGSQT